MGLSTRSIGDVEIVRMSGDFTVGGPGTMSRPLDLKGERLEDLGGYLTGLLDRGHRKIVLDLSGNDRYFRRGNGKPIMRDTVAGDLRTWNVGAKPGRAGQGRNVSIGRDCLKGRIGFLDAWPAREP